MASSTTTIAVLRQATEQAATALLKSSEAQDALRRRVAELEAEIKKAMNDRETLTKELNELKEENAELQDDLRAGQTEIKLLSQDQELLQKELDLERSSNKRLQNELREFEHRAEDFQHLDEILDTLNEKAKEYTQLEEQLQATKSIEPRFGQSQAMIEKLRGCIWGLKDERDLKEPLVQTAVAIRTRFIKQARKKLSGEWGEELNAEYLRFGEETDWLTKLSCLLDSWMVKDGSRFLRRFTGRSLESLLMFLKVYEERGIAGSLLDSSSMPEGQVHHFKHDPRRSP
jgi:chromosome segregation ATPase